MQNQFLNNNKAVIYARVSSKEQEREGYSIPAQLKLLRAYVLENDLIVVKDFIDIETAKKSGRTNFNNMISFIQNNQDVKNILCEKTDRLYRNFRDYVTIDDLDLSVILIKEGSVLNNESTSHEKFIHGIKLLMAKNYIDNLSEETKKGLNEKAERGEYPNRPAVGYVNKNKKIIVDKEISPIIKEVFERYATDQYSIRGIADYATELGLTSRTGKKVNPSVIYNILQNPFYYGDFFWNRKIYQGVHPPIITKELYDRVQKIFEKNKRVTQKKRDYAYCGLLRCSDCGCAITAETQKRKYIYYHCTFNKGKHNKIYVREEEIEGQYSEIFKRLHLANDQINRFIDVFNKKKEENLESLRNKNQEMQEKYKILEKRMNNAYAARLEQRINEEEYSSLVKRLEDQQIRIEAHILKLKNLIKNYLPYSIELLVRAQGAYAKFSESDQDKRVELIKSLMHVSEFKSGKIVPVFKHPLDILHRIINKSENNKQSKIKRKYSNEQTRNTHDQMVLESGRRNLN